MAFRRGNTNAGDGVRLLLALLIFTTLGGANAQYAYNHAAHTPHDPPNDG